MREEKMRRIRMVLSKDQLMTFVGGLHEMQLQMIDEAVEMKEKDGFPEAKTIIDSIRKKSIGNQ
jgi:vacuolar-type H+-ATPase subunit I/STV1